MTSPVLNFALFQTAWFFAVASASVGVWLLGSIMILVVLAFRLKVTPEPGREFLLMVAALPTGLIVESVQIAAGLWEPAGGATLGFLSPLWLLVMWPNFAGVLNGGLKWLSRRYWLCVLFGSTGGPLTYYGASRIGAIELSSLTTTMLVFAVVWGVVTPALVWLNDQLGD